MPAEGLEIRKIFIALSEREREAQKKKRDTTYKIYIFIKSFDLLELFVVDQII